MRHRLSAQSCQVVRHGTASTWLLNGENPPILARVRIRYRIACVPRARVLTYRRQIEYAVFSARQNPMTSYSLFLVNANNRHTAAPAHVTPCADFTSLPSGLETDPLLMVSRSTETI